MIVKKGKGRALLNEALHREYDMFDSDLTDVESLTIFDAVLDEFVGTWSSDDDAVDALLEVLEKVFGEDI